MVNSYHKAEVKKDEWGRGGNDLEKLRKHNNGGGKGGERREASFHQVLKPQRAKKKIGRKERKGGGGPPVEFGPYIARFRGTCYCSGEGEV